MKLVGPLGQTTLLPNPDLNNSEAVRDQATIRQSMNGTFYSYVKKTNLRELNFTWSHVGRGKMVEVQQFLKAFAGEKIMLTDPYDEKFKCVFTSDALTFTTASRSFNGGAARKESGSMSLTLLGEPF